MPLPRPISAAAALAQLTHSRWALPILATVAQLGGCKRVTLTHRLGVSAASLNRALDRLAALGLVIRNPGYGHPLRPEYVLGPVGARADVLPAEILAWSATVDDADQILKKWQLPVLVALTPDARRFGEVRQQMPRATPRAVTLALKSNAALGLISRVIEPGYPPIPQYTPTQLALPGREPARLLGELLAAQP